MNLHLYLDTRGCIIINFLYTCIINARLEKRARPFNNEFFFVVCKKAIIVSVDLKILKYIQCCGQGWCNAPEIGPVFHLIYAIIITTKL